MKLIRFLCLVCLIFLMSCQDIKEVEKPKKLLNKSEMKDLVYDMVLLDAAFGVNERRLKELDIEMLEFLSKKYELDSNDLKQNILYYNLRFDENLSIYQEVKDSIERLDRVYIDRAKEIDSLEKLERDRKDSISRSKDSIKKLTKKKKKED